MDKRERLLSYMRETYRQEGELINDNDVMFGEELFFDSDGAYVHVVDRDGYLYSWHWKEENYKEWDDIDYSNPDYISPENAIAEEAYISEIKELRLSTRMTQQEFADYFNIPMRTIQNWEGGQRTPPEYLVELIRYKIENEKKCPGQ